MIGLLEPQKFVFLETAHIYHCETAAWNCGTFWLLERLLM
jgi:hypothetical protein